MRVRDFIEITKRPSKEICVEEWISGRKAALLFLKNQKLTGEELDYVKKHFFFDNSYLGFMESEVFFEILKNLNRQGFWDKNICRDFYEYLFAYGWKWEAYIVMRLFLLEKLVTISKFCEEYDFYIDGTPQFLEEPVWENIDFRKDFDNNFE